MSEDREEGQVNDGFVPDNPPNKPVQCLKTVRFEPLAAHHVDSILKIEQEANPAPWSDRSFLNELTNPQSVFLVAFGDGRVVGYGGYWRCIDEAHITTVAVAESARRQGIGKRLMHTLLNRAIDEGMICSTLEVRAGVGPDTRMEPESYLTAHGYLTAGSTVKNDFHNGLSLRS